MSTRRRGAANRRKKIMEPKYVVYECENCGKLFYREVEEVLTDDAAHCEVNVKLIAEKETNTINYLNSCGAGIKVQ